MNLWSICTLRLSVHKSAIVVFTRKKTMPHIGVQVQLQEISVVNKFKSLGVYLDSRLRGVHHINHLASKYNRVVPILKALPGVWWGTHLYSMKLVFNALICSILDYGLFLLILCNRAALSTLDRLQSRCLRIITNSIKIFPINV